MTERVVDDTTGILVAPEVSALRDTLERIVAEAPLRARWGAAGRDRAQAYSLNVVVRAWGQVSRDVLEGRARGPKMQEAQ